MTKIKNNTATSVLACTFINKIAIIFILLITACNQNIDLKLPTYEPKLVLEFYLEDKMPIRCLLQESVSYTASATPRLIENALVILSYEGTQDTLLNIPFFDENTEKLYNYTNPKIFQAQADVLYEVYVKDTEGREMRGQTRFITPIPIDSLVYRANAIDSISAGLIFTDPLSEANFYRLIAYEERADFKIENSSDIQLRDIAFEGQQFSFFTGPNFARQDTIIGRLYHLTKEHYDFVESAQNARVANGNPFAQPADIRSNVSGGLGIFTSINFDEKRIIIPEAP
jgi:hypothetical protein